MSATTGYPPNESSPGEDAAVAIRRFVNDEIAETASRFGGDDASEYQFVCECGELSCQGRVVMTLRQYRLSEPGSVVGH
jgi:hypothetical protein